MSVFRFKQFWVHQADNAMKVGTDAMVLGSFVYSENRKRGLDIGAGTGVLSLMVAQNNAEIKIDAVELDSLSAKECQMNFDLSPWKERLQAHQSDFIQFETATRYDLIFSNPPYYESRFENNDNRKATARHEAALPKSTLLKKVSELIEDDGLFYVIVPADQAADWESDANLYGLKLYREINVFGKTGGKLVRKIQTYAKDWEFPSKSMDFTIRTSEGDYTNDYKSLTKEFHFNEL